MLLSIWTADRSTPPPTIMVLTLGHLSQRGYPAERHELTELYRQHVCATTCEIFLKMCSDGELRRLVFIGIYAQQYTAYHNRGALIRKLARVVGVHRATGHDYAKQYDETRVRAVK